MAEKTALYHKYRPCKLSQVLGQDHVKQTITNAVNKNRLSHAYLFTGSHGTGKTSLARIISLIVNCDGGPSVEYDENSKICQSIINGSCPDIHELDAGSSGNVDSIRDVIKMAYNAPVYCRKRVFIIDEAHGLTGSAKSSLLKTLEEPPKTAMFILCTTESQKIISTIQSRCQRFDINRIPTDKIASHLKEICDKEGRKNVANEALEIISKAAQGSVRDALSMLDAAMSRCDDEITAKFVSEIIGKTNFEFCLRTFDAILKQDYKSVLIVREAINKGIDPQRIFADFLEYNHDLLIGKSLNSDRHIREEATLKNAWIAQRDSVSDKKIVLFNQILCKHLNDSLVVHKPELSLDVCMIQMVQSMKT